MPTTSDLIETCATAIEIWGALYLITRTAQALRRNTQQPTTPGEN
ncbi:hypothetical protein [Mycolicibacterium llatzerense]|nr:hypothetical protein [Mycolicibacterium llatzerense]